MRPLGFAISVARCQNSKYSQSNASTIFEGRPRQMPGNNVGPQRQRRRGRQQRQQQAKQVFRVALREDLQNNCAYSTIQTRLKPFTKQNCSVRWDAMKHQHYVEVPEAPECFYLQHHPMCDLLCRACRELPGRALNGTAIVPAKYPEATWV